MNKIALLVIDVQNALVDLKPLDFDHVLAHINLLIDAQRALGGIVVFVQHTEDKGSDFEEQSKGWELYPAIKPLQNELVMKKRYNSAFKDTKLDEYLKDKGIDKLIIVGMQTEFCIDATIKSAFDLGYEIIIPEKTNTTFDNDLLTAKQIYVHHNYYIFNGNFGSVLSMDGVLEIIRESSIT